MDLGLGLGTASTLEVTSLVELASGGVDVTALAQGDVSVVASTGGGATIGDIGTGELVADALINTRLGGCEDDVSMLYESFIEVPRK